MEEYKGVSRSCPCVTSLAERSFLFCRVHSATGLVSRKFSSSTVIGRVMRRGLFRCPARGSVAHVTGTYVGQLRTLRSSSLISTVTSRPASITGRVYLCTLVGRDQLI